MKDGDFVIAKQENEVRFARVAEINREQETVLLDEYCLSLFFRRNGMKELSLAEADDYRVMTDDEVKNFFAVLRTIGERNLFDPNVQETFMTLRERVLEIDERSFLYENA